MFDEMFQQHIFLNTAVAFVASHPLLNAHCSVSNFTEGVYLYAFF